MIQDGNMFHMVYVINKQTNKIISIKVSYSYCATFSDPLWLLV